MNEREAGVSSRSPDDPVVIGEADRRNAISRFIKPMLTLGAILAMLIAAAPACARTFVYVSSAIDGDIDSYAMDADSGQLTPLGKIAAGRLVMPMTTSPDHRHLYAVVRTKPPAVLTYDIDPQSGKLDQRASAPLPDTMDYVSTDAAGRFLFTASYDEGKIAVSPIEPDARVRKDAIQVVPIGKNAHAIRADASNRFVYATDLGSNQILQFRFDAATGKLTANEPALVKAPPDNGPRHLVFSPDDRYLYVLNEMSGNVAQFAIDPASGALREIAYTGSVPPDSGLQTGRAYDPKAAVQPPHDDTPRIWCADVQITPNGKFIYTTERRRSRISLMRVATDSGRLSYVTDYATEAQPRGIRVDASGRFLVASGERSDRLSVYRIDQGDGRLALVGRYPVGHDANWVEIVSLP